MARKYRLLAVGSRTSSTAAASVGEVLHVPQDEDLAVAGIHAFDGRLQAPPDLGENGFLVGRSPFRGELLGEDDRGDSRRGLSIDGDLSARIPRLGGEMAPVGVAELLRRKPPEPEEERSGRVPEVLPEPLRSLEEDLLEDVRGIDPRLEPGVEADLHHASQSVPMRAKEAGEERLPLHLVREAPELLGLAEVAGRSAQRASGQRRCLWRKANVPSPLMVWTPRCFP